MAPPREIISLYVGQAGCEIGKSCWEMICLEHGIGYDGVVCEKADQGQAQNFFSATGANKLVPRACFIDLEPSTLDSIRTGHFRKLYSPDSLISGNQDAANCFARGYFSLANTIMGPVTNQIRMMAENCNMLQGFLIHRACGGGTGSGLTARLLEHLHHEYPKSSRFEVSLHSDPRQSPVIVEPYNTALSVHDSLECNDGSIIADNGAYFNICQRLLDLRSPSYVHVNQLLAQALTSVTSSLRFEGCLNVNLEELKTNLIPHPRIQYLLTSFAPLVSRKGLQYQNITEAALLNSCFDQSNQLAKTERSGGKYMACTILFRGDVSKASVDAAVSTIRRKKSIQFVNWSPTGFKVGINQRTPATVPGGHISHDGRVCVMVANSTAVRSIWTSLNDKFQRMLSKKAFLHWYLEQGMEEAEFHEAKLDLLSLEDDYLQLELTST